MVYIIRQKTLYLSLPLYTLILVFFVPFSDTLKNSVPHFTDSHHTHSLFVISLLPCILYPAELLQTPTRLLISLSSTSEP
ncbi:hypothetical protein E2C01_023171 [Portunus trituberculatus]|uniref:Uncharacterized protein n=1 Tax=Portunus trituberculatus TaxID=210409 RepID=A0A5B7E836_PORTR|nr:hypothetical protein [Portunus trituberculatus]